jgi:hypothetical protein
MLEKNTGHTEAAESTKWVGRRKRKNTEEEEKKCKYY